MSKVVLAICIGSKLTLKTELGDSADKGVRTGARGEATKIWTKEQQASGGYRLFEELFFVC